MKFKIDDKYYVHTDTHNWILSENKISEEGNHYTKDLKFSGSLEGIINCYVKMNLFCSEAESLKDALEDVERIVTNVTKAFEPEFTVKENK